MMHKKINLSIAEISHPKKYPKRLLSLTLVLSLLQILLSPANSHAQAWNPIAINDQIASGSSAHTGIAVIGDVVGIPYVVYIESGSVKVKKYDLGEWHAVGNPLTTSNSSYSRIYTDKNDKLYVTYLDGSNNNRLAVKTFNEGSNTWEALQGDNQNLFVSDGSVTHGVNAYGTTQRYALSFDSNDVPYIAYGEGDPRRAVVKKFIDGAWEVVGGGAVSTLRAVSISMAVDEESDRPYVVFSSVANATASLGSLTAFRLNGDSWENLPIPNPVSPGSATTGNATSIRHCVINFNSQWNPVVSYFNERSSNRSTILTYDKAAGTWTFNGTVSTRDVTNNTLTRDRQGNLYNSFTDAIANNSGRSVATVMKQDAGTLTWSQLHTHDRDNGIDEPSAHLSFGVSGNGEHLFVAYIQSNRPVVRVQAEEGVEPEPIEPDEVVTTARQMEFLTRGLVAVRTAPESVYIGWRMLGTDPENISFNLYRNGVKLNESPITTSTNFVDNTVENGTYTVAAVIDGSEQPQSQEVQPWASFLKQIPLDVPANQTMPNGTTCSYSPNDCSVGDLDGDGEYEIIVKWDPSNSQDNSLSGYTGTVFIDAYKLDGTRLWRIDLGRNIRAGAHYTQLMVYDLDGDGKAEVALKTADGTIDGLGVVIGDLNADYRNSSGYVLSGPEFLTVFNGETGAAMATTNYLPARGSVSSWGDNYGNRVDRFVDAIAYLDGQRPSLVTGRGYYTRLVRVAWDWRNGQLTHRWTFDSADMGNALYAGQGNHQVSVADVDGDGKDELINGSSIINDNGLGHRNFRFGHGDAMHVTQMDPNIDSQGLWICLETPGSYGTHGLQYRNLSTGELIFGVPTTGDVGRAMAADIDPNYPGYELWGTGGISNTYNINGEIIAPRRPSVNFGLWWDGDLGREILDGVKLDKWNPDTKSVELLQMFSDFGNSQSNNTTKQNPGLTADLFGDWREEVVLRSADNRFLNIFTTTIPTEHRLYTLMHNPQYRAAVAWQNTAYNQPPYPDYFLGYDMETPPQPNIYLAQSDPLPVTLAGFRANTSENTVLLTWETTEESQSSHFEVERSRDGRNFEVLGSVAAAGQSENLARYSYRDGTPLSGVSYYRLRSVDTDGTHSYSHTLSVRIHGTIKTLVVSPNPADKNITISLGEATTGKVRLSLYASNGMQILTTEGTLEKVNERISEIVPGLSAGVYLVRVADDKDLYSGKLIRKN